MLIPIKAAAGALVRHPFTKQPLPHVGGDEEPFMAEDTDLHWARLLVDGDVVRDDPPPAAPPKPAASRGRSSSQGDHA